MENQKDSVGLQLSKLNLNDIVESVTSPNCGAVSTFIGMTRDSFEEKKVLKLEYEAYESMALKEMKKICDKIRSKFAVEKIAIHHRLGHVPVTEASIIIAISSPHRSESLQAVQLAIDIVKSNLPIWKKEVYEGSTSEWKENAECCWTKTKIKIEPMQREGNVKIMDVHDSINIKSETLNESSDECLDNSQQSPSNYVDYSKCQIKRSVDEMFNRIESFCSNKKEKASTIKFQENYYFSQSQDNSDENDKTCVCSRVNIIWIKHKRNRRDVRRVYNQWSHQNTKPNIQLDCTNNYPSALEERLSTTETLLGMNKPVPADVYKRIKKIEDRILFLESISPEYKNLWTNIMKENSENLNDKFQTKCADNLISDHRRKRCYSPAELNSSLHESDLGYGKKFR